MNVYLVLQYNGEMYVDSAWSTADAAARRVVDIERSRKAFRAYDAQSLRTLEISLDAGGMTVQIQLPEPPPIPDHEAVPEAVPDGAQ